MRPTLDFRPPAVARVVAALGLLASPFFVAAPPAGAQLDVEPKAELRLAADRAAYPHAATARIAARVTIEDGWHVNSNTPTYDYLIPTELTLEVDGAGGDAPVRYPAHRLQKFAFTDEPIAVYDGTFTLFAELALPAAGETASVGAKLRYQACDDSQCLPPVTAEATLDLPLGSAGEPANEDLFAAATGTTLSAPASPIPSPPAAGGEGQGEGGSESAPVPAAGQGEGVPASASPAKPGLLLTLLFGLLGGLLLNAMPCVLPVLSLKVFSLVESAGHGRAAVARGALATAAGILVSFWLLAGLVVVARRAGDTVGWGVQFQEPGFVAFLAVVMVLFALNMWGLFEIPLPARLATAAGGAQGAPGLAGHFATGLFATLMATPCSAPFLGAAVGFALSQSAPTVVAVFTAVGVGLALPYLVLAAAPGAGRLLPRPGEWMVTLKGAMGFLLAAAAVWLFYVLAAQVPPEIVAGFQLLLLAVALFAWLHGRSPFGSRRRAVALVAALAAAGAGIVVAARAPERAGSAALAGGRYEWVAFDETEAERLAASGRLVFVDVTADWCLTCKATERLVLDTDATARLFAEHDVVPMKADWTRRDDAITAFLGRFGRSAVPFYVLYRPGRPPHAFGELLTAGGLAEVVAESSAARTALARDGD